MMRRLWPDSLLTRLLLLQGLVVASAVLLFSAMLVVERNVLLAPQYAILWASAMRQSAQAPVGSPAVPAAKLVGGVRRELERPRWSVHSLPATFQAVREALAPFGFQVDEVRLTITNGVVQGWLAVRVDGAPAVWISVNGYPWQPGWSPRLVLALVLILLIVAAASRYFVRRVARPLEALHGRMLHHARTGQVLAPVPALPGQRPSPELQAMDQAYTQLAERLARNERERALLLAGVSHDLRSPLARIRLAAEMLPETADNADGVAAVTRNVDQADRLIASFLEFVRVGTQSLDETVDAAAVVRQAVAGFGQPTDRLSVRTPHRLLLHKANGLLLDRLVVNLVDNALKHGGVPVQVVLVCYEDVALLTVSDQGPGLPAGGAERLMEAFARGDTSRGVPGFGLGLAIVHQIVHRLQGRLRFDQGAAGAPVGLTVEVRLPLTPPQSLRS